ncbi:MAG: glycosyltransferase family 4 protein [Anaerolineae bacterium]|nr:glycosyltransferase family 4 protein [Anaerolineae bacterium]
MVTITIDYTPAYEQGAGIGRLIRELTHALAHVDSSTEYKLFVAGANKKPLPPLPGPNFSFRSTRITPQWLARIWQRAHLPIPVEVFTGQHDLYHATDFVLPPTLPSTKTILTVHDLSFVKVPETASPSLKRYLDEVAPRSLKRADYIIADSIATKDDSADVYGIGPDKISVVYGAIQPDFRHIDDAATVQFIRDKYGLGSRPYLLAVGTVQPRKNYSRIIQALAILRSEGHDIQFVIAGGKGWLQDEMYATMDATKMSDYVKLIGYADDADLPVLYSQAACVVFPTLYEGFGFPILEGMACGTPVVTSNVSSLPEVAADAAIIVDPYDVDAIADGIRRSLMDGALRDRLIEAGYQRASEFTWQKSAESLWQVYQHVLQM